MGKHPKASSADALLPALRAEIGEPGHFPCVIISIDDWRMFEMQQLMEKMTEAAELSVLADEKKDKERESRNQATHASNSARNAWNDVADLIIQIVGNDKHAADSKLGTMVKRLDPR